MKRNRREVLLAALLCVAHGSVYADRESWSVNSAWVKELTGTEQAAILFMLRGAFNQHVTRKVAPNALKSSQDFVWMLKLQAVASFMLSELATKNEDMRQFFVQYADRLAHIIRTGDLANYMADGDWANTQMRRFLSQIGESYMLTAANQYARRLTDTGTALIAFAATRAK